MENEPSDPLERADQRRKAGTDGEDGTVAQRGHGSIDETTAPKRGEGPAEAPAAPAHDRVDPDFEPAGTPAHRPGHGDPSA
jgi:hypothetical protein